MNAQPKSSEIFRSDERQPNQLINQDTSASAPQPLNDPVPESTSVENSGVELPKIISFDTLARCGEEIWIENNGQIYRLRRTKQGKLILTK